MALSVFPSTNSIPPASFYNMRGLTNWLNNNPSYKQYYINHPVQFPNLYPMNSTLSSISYVIENIPLGPHVTTLSQSQSILYQQQLQLFQKVYTFNSNAYVNYTVGEGPFYYSFRSYQEMMQYKSAVSMVNKMYPFDIMASAKNENGDTMSWIVPFPL